jgi:hypothetical protein
MDKEKYEVLANIDNFISVERFENGMGEILQVNIMNMTFRMCPANFERLTIALNEAMVKLNDQNVHYKNMASLFRFYKTEAYSKIKNIFGKN